MFSIPQFDPLWFLKYFLSRVFWTVQRPKELKAKICEEIEKVPLLYPRQNNAKHQKTAYSVYGKWEGVVKYIIWFKNYKKTLRMYLHHKINKNSLVLPWVLFRFKKERYVAPHCM